MDPVIKTESNGETQQSNVETSTQKDIGIFFEPPNVFRDKNYLE